MKYRTVDDQDQVCFLRQALRENENYCISVPDSKGKEEFFCPCKEFREADKGTVCRCGLYVKVKK